MTMPSDPKEQMDAALEEAWRAAERCTSLLDDNNGGSAVVWAASAQAWATIAGSIALRLP
ncbi:MAG: hypothetical protein H0W25_09520 [Acidimicrobiia bacterium]|nr:hypothetical protein [Acidimicrobiia bacterium]